MPRSKMVPGSKEGTPERGGNVLTQKMGPLPTWGWLVVAVGAIFLYRRMTGAAGASGTTASGVNIDPSTGLPYGSGSVGGVFLIPSNTTAPAATTTAPSTTTQAPVDPFASFLSTYAADQQQIASLVSSGQYGNNPFLSQTAAAAQLGLPHVIGQAGNAFVLNPATGQTVPVATWNALPQEQQQALGTGNSGLWQQFTARTGAFAPAVTVQAAA